jgi:ketosteroid isomerase-like protein
MKTRLAIPLLGLAISFALPTYAQQRNTPDPKLRERFISCFKALIDALDKSDAAASAANFTEDAVLVTPYGPVFGQQAIQAWYADLLKTVQLSIDFFPVDEDSPHVLGRAGNELWATGKCSGTAKGLNGSVLGKGYWSAIDIREGDDWKFQMLCYSLTLAPAATASPTTTPSNQ